MDYIHNTEGLGSSTNPMGGVSIKETKNGKPNEQHPIPRHNTTNDLLSTTTAGTHTGIMAGDGTTRKLLITPNDNRDSPSIDSYTRPKVPSTSSDTSTKPGDDHFWTLVVDINAATDPVLEYPAISVNGGDEPSHGSTVPDYALFSY